MPAKKAAKSKAAAATSNVWAWVGTDDLRVKEAASKKARELTPPEAGEFGLEIIEGGAWGSIEYGDLGRHGLLAIRTIWEGEIWGSRKVLSRIVHANVRQATEQITLSKAMQALTGRESEIVKLLQTGSSNKEIAAKLAISDQTVKTHVHNIFSKLNVSRRNKIFPKLFS